MNPAVPLRATVLASYLAIYTPPANARTKVQMLDAIRYFRRLRYHFGDAARLAPGKGNRSIRRRNALGLHCNPYTLNALGLLRKDGAYHIGL